GARLALERGQLLRDRGRGVAEDRGGPGDTAAGGELLEQTEPVQVEHKRTLLSAIEISACTYGLGTGKLSRCARLHSKKALVPAAFPQIPQLGSASPLGSHHHAPVSPAPSPPGPGHPASPAEPGPHP